jgi:N-methylhydantoinase B
LGLRRVIRPVDHACAFNGVGERFRHRPWGLFGGEAGSTGRFVVVGDDGSQETLPGKVLDRLLRPDQALVAETPGAGGYGSPHDRIRLAVDEDGRTGKFSAAFVDEHYGRLDGSVDF